jgi:hypothetical protein
MAAPFTGFEWNRPPGLSLEFLHFSGTLKTNW